MKTIRAVFIDLAAESDSVKRRFVKLDKRGKPPEIIEDRTLGPHSSWMLRKVTEDGDAIYHPA